MFQFNHIIDSLRGADASGVSYSVYYIRPTLWFRFAGEIVVGIISKCMYLFVLKQKEKKNKREKWI